MKFPVHNHLVVDDAFNNVLVRKAAVAWPAPGDPGWVTYDTPLENKRAFNDWRRMPLPCADLLCLLAARSKGPGLVPDLSLWGAGLHEMGPGGFLDLHLDADHHKHFGLERRTNAVLFLSPWEDGWGGALELWRPDETAPAETIVPRRNRMVLFDAGDYSLHRVARVTCPLGARRKTLTMFWYGSPRGHLTRPRALFVPLPGEGPDAVKDALRAERSR